MLLIPKAAKELIDKGRAAVYLAGRAEGHEAGWAERDARYEEAYRRFGIEVDGVVVLPRTPEVQAFLDNDSEEPGQRRG